MGLIAELEGDDDSIDPARALEDRPAGSGVKAQCVPLPLRAVRKPDGQCIFSAKLIDDRSLTVRKGQRAGFEAQTPRLPRYAPVIKVRRRRKKFLVTQKQRPKTKLTRLDEHAQLAPAAENILL